MQLKKKKKGEEEEEEEEEVMRGKLWRLATLFVFLGFYASSFCSLSAGLCGWSCVCVGAVVVACTCFDLLH